MSACCGTRMMNQQLRHLFSIALVLATSLPQLCQPSETQNTLVANSWILPDVSASVGRVFKYHIPKRSSQDNVTQSYVTEAGTDKLPTWLHFETSTNLLQGVPLVQDEGYMYISVMVYSEDNKELPHQSITDVFSIDVRLRQHQDNLSHKENAMSVSSEQQYDAKFNQKRIKCRSEQATYTASLVLDVRIESLRGGQRVTLVENLADFVAKHVDDIKLSARRSSTVSRLLDADVLAAGPGNINITEMHPSKLTQGVELTWPLACGGFPKLTDFVRVISHNIEVGTISDVTEFRVIGWYVTREQPALRLQKMTRDRREKRQAPGNYATPVPTPTITSAPPTAYMSSTTEILQISSSSPQISPSPTTSRITITLQSSLLPVLSSSVDVPMTATISRDVFPTTTVPIFRPQSSSLITETVQVSSTAPPHSDFPPVSASLSTFPYSSTMYLASPELGLTSTVTPDTSSTQVSVTKTGTPQSVSSPSSEIRLTSFVGSLETPYITSTIEGSFPTSFPSTTGMISTLSSAVLSTDQFPSTIMTESFPTSTILSSAAETVSASSGMLLFSSTPLSSLVVTSLTLSATASLQSQSLPSNLLPSTLILPTVPLMPTSVLYSTTDDSATLTLVPSVLQSTSRTFVTEVSLTSSVATPAFSTTHSPVIPPTSTLMIQPSPSDISTSVSTISVPIPFSSDISTIVILPVTATEGMVSPTPGLIKSTLLSSESPMLLTTTASVPRMTLTTSTPGEQSSSMPYAPSHSFLVSSILSSDIASPALTTSVSDISPMLMSSLELDMSQRLSVPYTFTASEASLSVSDVMSTVLPISSTMLPDTSQIYSSGYISATSMLIKSSSVSPETSTLFPGTSQVLPETSTLFPGTSQVLPETSTLFPGTSQVLPETSTLFPGTSQVLPETSTLFPGTSQVLPETSTLFPGTSQVLAETSTLFPGTSQVLPETSTLFPGTSQVLPEISTLFPGTSHMLPETSTVFPGTSQVLPETSTLYPGTSQVLPETSTLFPGTSQGLPDSSDLSLSTLSMLLPRTSAVVPDSSAYTGMSSLPGIISTMQETLTATQLTSSISPELSTTILSSSIPASMLPPSTPTATMLPTLLSSRTFPSSTSSLISTVVPSHLRPTSDLRSSSASSLTPSMPVLETSMGIGSESLLAPSYSTTLYGKPSFLSSPRVVPSSSIPYVTMVIPTLLIDSSFYHGAPSLSLSITTVIPLVSTQVGTIIPKTSTTNPSFHSTSHMTQNTGALFHSSIASSQEPRSAVMSSTIFPSHRPTLTSFSPITTSYPSPMIISITTVQLSSSASISSPLFLTPSTSSTNPTVSLSTYAPSSQSFRSSQYHLTSLAPSPSYHYIQTSSTPITSIPPSTSIAFPSPVLSSLSHQMPSVLSNGFPSSPYVSQSATKITSSAKISSSVTTGLSTILTTPSLKTSSSPTSFTLITSLLFPISSPSSTSISYTAYSPITPPVSQPIISPSSISSSLLILSSYLSPQTTHQSSTQTPNSTPSIHMSTQQSTEYVTETVLRSSHASGGGSSSSNTVYVSPVSITTALLTVSSSMIYVNPVSSGTVITSQSSLIQSMRSIHQSELSIVATPTPLMTQSTPRPPTPSTASADSESIAPVTTVAIMPSPSIPMAVSITSMSSVLTGSLGLPSLTVITPSVSGRFSTALETPITITPTPAFSVIESMISKSPVFTQSPVISSDYVASTLTVTIPSETLRMSTAIATDIAVTPTLSISVVESTARFTPPLTIVTSPSESLRTPSASATTSVIMSTPSYSGVESTSIVLTESLRPSTLTVTTPSKSLRPSSAVETPIMITATPSSSLSVVSATSFIPELTDSVIPSTLISITTPSMSLRTSTLEMISAITPTPSYPVVQSTTSLVPVLTMTAPSESIRMSTDTETTFVITPTQSSAPVMPESLVISATASLTSAAQSQSLTLPTGMVTETIILPTPVMSPSHLPPSVSDYTSTAPPVSSTGTVTETMIAPTHIVSLTQTLSSPSDFISTASPMPPLSTVTETMISPTPTESLTRIPTSQSVYISTELPMSSTGTVTETLIQPTSTRTSSLVSPSSSMPSMTSIPSISTSSQTLRSLPITTQIGVTSSGGPMRSTILPPLTPTPSLELITSSTSSLATHEITLVPTLTLTVQPNPSSSGSILPTSTLLASLSTVSSMLPSNVASSVTPSPSIPVSSTVAIFSTLSPTPTPMLTSTVGVVESSSEVIPSPTPVQPSSSVMMSSSVLPDVTTPEPINQPPILLNPVDKVTANLGAFLQQSIPTDTFYDPEDGYTPNLSLSLRTMDHAPVPPHSWLQLDPVEQVLYGVPLNSTVENYEVQYYLTAVDSEGLIAFDAMVVVIVPSTDIYNHEFSVEIDDSYPNFIADGRNIVQLSTKVAAFYSDVNASALYVESLSEGSVILTYSNTSLDVNVCDLTTINALFNQISYPNGTATLDFATHMLPEYPVLFVTKRLQGTCSLPPTIAPTAGNVTALPITDKNLVAIIVVPAVLIAALLLLICCLVCCWYKRNRAGEEFLLYEEKRTYAKNRKPIFLNDELTGLEPNKPTHPVVLPDDISPFMATPKHSAAATPLEKKRPAPPTYRLPDFAKSNPYFDHHDQDQPEYWNPDYKKPDILLIDMSLPNTRLPPPPRYTSQPEFTQPPFSHRTPPPVMPTRTPYSPPDVEVHRPPPRYTLPPPYDDEGERGFFPTSHV